MLSLSKREEPASPLALSAARKRASKGDELRTRPVKETAPRCLCGEPPVAQARDHNFRRDIAAAGAWAAGSGNFNDEQITKLREQLDGLIKLPDVRNPDVGASGARTTLLHRPAENEPGVVALVAEQDGKAGKVEPVVVAPNSAGEAGRNAKPGSEAATLAAAPASPPNDAESAQVAHSGDKRMAEASAVETTDAATRNPVRREWRERIAQRETRGEPKGGYGAVHLRSEDLGRYQLSRKSLQQIGLRRRNGSWTGKYGVKSQEEFLKNRDAQERALDDYVADNKRQLKYFGAHSHIDQMVDGTRAQFRITESGLAAAAHRQGARAVSDFVRHLESRGWRADYQGLTEETVRIYRRIETRLREFADVPLR